MTHKRTHITYILYVCYILYIFYIFYTHECRIKQHILHVFYATNLNRKNVWATVLRYSLLYQLLYQLRNFHINDKHT